MKKFILFRKIRVQLIAAIGISLFISLVSLIVVSNLLQNFVWRYINNEENINMLFIYLSAAIVLIVPIIAFIITFLILVGKKVRYIKYISEQVNKIAKEELGLTLKVSGNDELAELCKNINYMSRELKDKFEHERELENTKTELITNVSHDLRTPLTAIIGYLDILKNKKYKSEEEEAEYLNSTYNLSLKLKRLINELFEYTKLSSSGIALKLEEVDLGSILIQMLGENTPVLEAKGLRIIADIDEEIYAKVDVEKIVRVFDNILSNAEKYSIRPSDLIVKTENKEGAVYISISNKGEYIKQDKLKKMFEKFYRVDISRSSHIEGSGLGLAISKRIVELHHGQIWAECEGNIITIHIKLPVSRKSW